MIINIKVEIGLGHRSSGSYFFHVKGSHLVYKITGSDQDFALIIGSCALVMVFGPDQKDQLSILDSDDGSISPDSIQGYLD